MADKPSYTAARKERHGTATMTIEPAPPTSFTDKSLPTPYQEHWTGHTISPEDNAHPGVKAVPAPTHPGEFGKSSLQSDVVKT